ncbi:MAG TPA: sigma-70 family RNA polymerase sigma factor [Gammaproteobacteria bacterium]
MDSRTDQALMLSFRDGDAAAFESLYGRHRASLYRFFGRQAAKACVDDLFQETWLRVIRGKSTYRPDGVFRAYLFRIAHNVLVDHYRREANPAQPSRSADIEAVDPASGPDSEYGIDALRTAIAGALTRMPAAQREVFLLHQDGGLTLEQIGEIVGAGRETVKSRLRYAVERLREALTEHPEVREKRA